jgi:ATPase family associated with various cellular activities (AAA)
MGDDMSTLAMPLWLENNRAQLLGEFARLRRLLGGDERENDPDVPEPAVWDCERPPAIEMLTAVFELSAFERDLLLLCAGVEMESDLGELCGSLTGRAQRNSPTFGLAMSLLPDPDWNALTPWAPLRRFRLVEVEPGHGLAGAPLRIDERILHFLAGSNRMDARLESLLHFKDARSPLAGEHETLVEQIAAEFLGRPEAMALHFHGDDPEAQETITARVAERFGRHLFVLRIEDAPTAGAELEQFLALWSREAMLLTAFLLLEWQGETPGANARAMAERMASPLLLASRDPQKLHRLTWRYEVNRPEPATQLELWKTALASVVEDDSRAPHSANGSGNARPSLLDTMLDRMAEQFRLSAETIATIADAAVAAGSDDAQSLASRLWQSCRAVSRPQLDLFAQRIEPRASWDDLVLPEAQMAVLRMLVSQAQNRMTVYEHWGFARRGRRGLGLSALFAGPSGTGKTLAAEVLANELELDLYRIDLSAVVSKYIGETEKNLKNVFDSAEQGGVVLLFDEAEALFGKRSEVRDSRDRYANIEVGYLLQRMESFQGVAILTTNVKATLDKAFQRRLRFTVEFPYPGPEEREAIWRRAIPRETPARGLDPARLAQLNMPGGNIRNIALNAAFLAAEEGQPLSMAQLREAAKLEASKVERPIAGVETRGWE